MVDPCGPRREPQYEACEQAGIRAGIITGNHPLTAQAVARELGPLKPGRVIAAARHPIRRDGRRPSRTRQIVLCNWRTMINLSAATGVCGIVLLQEGL